MSTKAIRVGRERRTGIGAQGRVRFRCARRRRRHVAGAATARRGDVAVGRVRRAAAATAVERRERANGVDTDDAK
jgi:hypothetical protein